MSSSQELYDLGYFEKDVNDPDQVIHNLSSYTLSDTEKALLAKGLNFTLPPKKINYADYMTPFELLFKKVKDCDVERHKLDILKIRNVEDCLFFIQPIQLPEGVESHAT